MNFDFLLNHCGMESLTGTFEKIMELKSKLEKAKTSNNV